MSLFDDSFFVASATFLHHNLRSGIILWITLLTGSSRASIVLTHIHLLNGQRLHVVPQFIQLVVGALYNLIKGPTL